jgi:cell division GTPase FtsZ
MKLGVVGIGQAGGKIVNALLEYEYDQRTTITLFFFWVSAGMDAFLCVSNPISRSGFEL